MSKGGFNLTKWLSNSSEVMDSFPESQSAEQVTRMKFDDKLTLGRTLGVQRNVANDKFLFDVHMTEKPHTRRGILSVASSLLDPLGHVAPVTLIPKLILQNLCKYGLKWNDAVHELESLLTLVTEVEKVLNDRSVSQISDDSRDPDQLTPNILILLRRNSSLPGGVFNKDDTCSKLWWRQAQYLADLFWRRWVKEYLPALQERQKWQNLQRNIVANDLVLLCDENLPRGRWPLGLVVDVIRGRDDLVRSCRVRSNGSIKVRPITKLCLLEQNTQ